MKREILSIIVMFGLFININAQSSIETTKLEDQIINLYNVKDQSKYNDIYLLIESLESKNTKNTSEKVKSIKKELSKYYIETGDQFLKSDNSKYKKYGVMSYQRALFLNKSKDLEKKYEALKVQNAQKVNINFDDKFKNISITSTMKKDVISYLNSKYSGLLFNNNSKSKSEITIDLKVSNFNMNYIINNIGTSENNSANYFRNLGAIVNFYTKVEIFESDNKLVNETNNHFLMSKDGLYKNDIFITNNALFTEIDRSFVDYIKLNNYINDNDIGLQGGNNINSQNVINSEKNINYSVMGYVYAILIAELDKAIEQNNLN